MARVHWSVWGFVGFFGMVLVGLWVDSRWLLGVGDEYEQLAAPITQIKQVRMPMGVHADDTHSATQVTPPTSATVVEPMEASPKEFSAAAEAHAREMTVGLSAPGIFGGGLEIPFDETSEGAEMSDGVERLPDPVVVEPFSERIEPIEQSEPIESENPLGLRRIGLDRDVPRAQAATAEEPGIPAIADIIERTSPVLRSKFFGGAGYSRDLQMQIANKMRADQAATPAPSSYDPLVSDLLPPPRPPLAVPAQFPAELADASAGSLQSAAVPPMREAPNHEHVERLREAAGQLDQIAQEMERHNLYHRADQVRAVAQELRVDARKLPAAPGSSPSSMMARPPR